MDKHKDPLLQVPTITRTATSAPNAYKQPRARIDKSHDHTMLVYEQGSNHLLQPHTLLRDSTALGDEIDRLLAQQLVGGRKGYFCLV